jgi:hypothetical protein
MLIWSCFNKLMNFPNCSSDFCFINHPLQGTFIFFGATSVDVGLSFTCLSSVWGIDSGAVVSISGPTLRLLNVIALTWAFGFPRYYLEACLAVFPRLSEQSDQFVFQNFGATLSISGAQLLAVKSGHRVLWTSH